MADRKPAKPLIVPVFIPNQGCPHRCIFCQQEKITSQPIRPLNGSTVKDILDTAIRSPRFDPEREPEVAFYGGTFTRLATSEIQTLLGAVAPYIKQGFFRSIRISTRPDALDEERLVLMRRMGVSTVELGVQSMDDEVLELIRRGYMAGDIVSAVGQLRQFGFRIGIQLMPGLPGDSREKFLQTVEKVIALKPDMVRLYPTIVIKGTALARLYYEKKYIPLRLEEAIEICGDSCTRLEEKGIPVIRMGLMSSPSLLKEGEIIAGPWHEAFGFLVRSAIHQKRIEPCLPERGESSEISLLVPKREIPLVRGYKNLGVRLIEDKTGATVTGVIPDESVPAGRVAVIKILQAGIKR